jgi:excisionase family DNA binding protein
VAPAVMLARGEMVEERYTIAEASELTGLSKRALARRIERGQLPSTKEGRLRYVQARDLAEAGLFDPVTRGPHAWARQRVEPNVVAREIVETLVRQSVEIHRLQRRVQELSDETKSDDDALRREIERARAERHELRKALDEARAAIHELRRVG